MFYVLPDIIDEKIVFTETRWKNIVRNAIKKMSEKNIQKEFLNYSKLKGKYENEHLVTKPYVSEMKLRQARTMFRARSSMLPVKMNQKSNPKYAAELW